MMKDFWTHAGTSGRKRICWDQEKGFAGEQLEAD
jgi:hypothetical protein